MANSTQLCECESPYIGNHCQYCSNGCYGDPRYVYIYKALKVNNQFLATKPKMNPKVWVVERIMSRVGPHL